MNDLFVSIFCNPIPLLITFCFDNHESKSIDLSKGDVIPEELRLALLDKQVKKYSYAKINTRKALERALKISLPVENWYSLRFWNQYVWVNNNYKHLYRDVKASNYVYVHEYQDMFLKPDIVDGEEVRKYPKDYPVEWENFKIHRVNGVNALREEFVKIVNYYKDSNLNRYECFVDKLNEKKLPINREKVTKIISDKKKYTHDMLAEFFEEYEITEEDIVLWNEMKKDSEERKHFVKKLLEKNKISLKRIYEYYEAFNKAYSVRINTNNTSFDKISCGKVEDIYITKATEWLSNHDTVKSYEKCEFILPEVGILAWLAGDERIVKLLTKEKNPIEVLSMDLFGKKTEEFQILTQKLFENCIYSCSEMGLVNAGITQCLPDEKITPLIELWRKKYKKLTDYSGKIYRAVSYCIEYNTEVELEKVKFSYRNNNVEIYLPNNTMITIPNVKIYYNAYGALEMKKTSYSEIDRNIITEVKLHSIKNMILMYLKDCIIKEMLVEADLRGVNIISYSSRKFIVECNKNNKSYRNTLKDIFPKWAEEIPITLKIERVEEVDD